MNLLNTFVFLSVLFTGVLGGCPMHSGWGTCKKKGSGAVDTSTCGTSPYNCEKDMWCGVNRLSNHTHVLVYRMVSETQNYISGSKTVCNNLESHPNTQLINSRELVECALDLYSSTSCFIADMAYTNSHITYPDGSTQLSDTVEEALCKGTYMRTLAGCGKGKVTAAAVSNSPLCYSWVAPVWTRRSSGLVEDTYVQEAGVNYTDATAICNRFGGTVLQLAENSASLIPNKRTVWVGIKSKKWIFDGTDDFNLRFLLNRDYTAYRLGLVHYYITSDVQRHDLGCTRRVINGSFKISRNLYARKPMEYEVDLSEEVKEHNSRSGTGIEIVCSLSGGHKIKVAVQKGEQSYSFLLTHDQPRDAVELSCAPTDDTYAVATVKGVFDFAPLNKVSFVSVPSRLFIGVTHTLFLEKNGTETPIVTVNSSGVTLGYSDAKIGAFNASGIAAVELSVAAPAGNHSLSLSVASECYCGKMSCNCYENSTTIDSLFVTPRDTLALVANESRLLVGSNITITVKPPTEVYENTTIVLSSGCPLTFTPSLLTLANGTSDSHEVLLSPHDDVSSVSSCAVLVTFTAPSDSPIQYSGYTPLSLVVGPRVRGSFSDLPSDLTANVSYTFQLVLSLVYTGEVINITLECDGVVFEDGSTRLFTPTTLSHSFTIRRGEGRCNMSAVVSGNGTSTVEAIESLLLIFTETRVTSATLASQLYRGQVGNLIVSCSVISQDNLTVRVTWHGEAGVVNKSVFSITLSSTTPSVETPIGLLKAGKGRFTFNITKKSTDKPQNYRDLVSPARLEVIEPSDVTVSPVAPRNMSIGSHYAVRLTFELPVTERNLHLGTSVSVALVFDTAVFNCSNPNTEDGCAVTWDSGSAYSAQSLVLTAISTSASSNVSFNVSGTTPQYVYGVTLWGNIMTYRRSTVKPEPTEGDVFGLGGVVTMTVIASSKPLLGPLLLGMSYTEDLRGPKILKIAANETNTSFTFAVERLAPESKNQITFTIHSSTPTAVSELFDNRIRSAFVTMHSLIRIKTKCDSDEMYYGPGNKIECNFTIDVAPPDGLILKVTPQASSAALVAPSEGAAFLGQAWMVFSITPQLSTDFTDTSQETIMFTVLDQSRRYNNQSIAVTFKKRILISNSLTVVERWYVKNLYTVCFFLAHAPKKGEELTIDTNEAITGVPSLELNVSALKFMENNTGPECVSVYSKVTGQVSIIATLEGSVDRFEKAFEQKTISVLPLQEVILVVSPGLLYINQRAKITINVQSGPGTNATLTVKLRMECNPAVEAPVSWSDEPNFTVTTTDSVNVDVTALKTCSQGTITATLGGTTTVFALDKRPSARLSIKDLKSFHVGTSKTVLYGGEEDSLLLLVNVSELPYVTDGELLATITTSHPSLIKLQENRFLFYTGGASGTRFRSATVTAALVSEPVSVMFQVNVTGVLSEYDVRENFTFQVEVRPVRPVAYSLDFHTGELYVGVSKTFSVTLPSVPASGVLVVTPVLEDGSPSAVSFFPLSAILNASHLSQSFVIEALEPTYSSEKLTVLYSYPIGGVGAVGYFPQPQAARHPIRFLAKGRVLLTGGVPTQLFAGQTEPVGVAVTYAPPAGEGDNSVTLKFYSNSSALTVTPGTVTWRVGDTILERTFYLQGHIVEDNVQLSYTMDGPAFYNLVLDTAIIDVVPSRKILWKVPPYIYLNQHVECQLTIGTRPASTMTLQFSALEALKVRGKVVFSPTSELSQSFLLIGVAVGSAVLSANYEGSGEYDPPVDRIVEVRALEKVTITGYTAAMYVGSSFPVSISLGRALQCANGEHLDVLPQFGTLDATFVPDTGARFDSGDNTTEKILTLKATQVTSGVIPLQFLLEGTPSCRRLFLPPVTPVSGVRIYPKETITLSVWPNMTNTTDGVHFIYVDNSIPLTIDLGTPVVPHKGVTVMLSYSGQRGSLSFERSEVKLQPGVNRLDVAMHAHQEAAAATIDLQLISGADAFTPMASPFQIRVLPRIRLTLYFDHRTQLIVTSATTELFVDVDSTAVVGDMNVEVRYGKPGKLKCVPVTYGARTTVLRRKLLVEGIEPSENATLTVVMTGSGGSFYFATQGVFYTPVYAQRYVDITAPDELFIGRENSRVFTLRLDSTPTLRNDKIEIALSSFESVSFSSERIELTAQILERNLTVMGKSFGSLRLYNIFTITSKEYSRKPLRDKTIDVLELLTGTLTGLVPVMFPSSEQNVTLTIPRAPRSGMLEVRPTMEGVEITPSVYHFTANTSLTVVFTIKAPAGHVQPAQLLFTATGSSEFASVLAHPTLQVVASNLVSFAGFPGEVYVGSTNKKSFSVIISGYPENNNNITVRLTPSEHYSIVPSTLRFGPDTALVQSCVVYGLIASNGALNVALTIDSPTHGYVVPLPSSLLVLSPETYEGAISTTDLYVNVEADVTLTFSKIPTGPVTVELIVEKTRRGTSTVPVDPADYAVLPSKSVLVAFKNNVIFRLKALRAPEQVQISFRVTGRAASEFSIYSIPTITARFLPLRKVVVDVPEKMYVGLPAQFNISIPAPPARGGLTVKFGVDQSNIKVSGVQQMTSNSPLTQRVTVIPSKIGTFDIPLELEKIWVTEFEDKTYPSSWTVRVEEPYDLDIFSPPAQVYEKNAITLQLDYGTLLPGEILTVKLVANDTVTIVPQQLVLPQDQFRVECDSARWVNFNLSFTSTVSRLRLARRLSEEGVTLHFRPLKKITVTEPPNEAFVGRTQQIRVALEESPSVGRSLVASISYSGSPSNVVLSPPALWDSTSTALERTLLITGRSPTSDATVTITFTGDSQYNTEPRTFQIKFNKIARITAQFPTAIFLGVLTPLILRLETYESIAVRVTHSPIALEFFSNPSSTAGTSSGTVTFIKNSENSGNEARVWVKATELRKAVTLTFAVEKDSFEAPAPVEVDVVATHSVIVDIPSRDLIVYLIDSYSVRMKFRIESPPSTGAVIVTPEMSCTSGETVVFSPAFVTFNSSEPRKLATFIDVTAKTASNGPCDLQFRVSGNFTPLFVAPGGLYSIESRPQYTIFLKNNVSRIFVGLENKIELVIAMDSAVVLPLTEPVKVDFDTTSKCVTLSPQALLWAAGNQEDREKAVYIEASCAEENIVVTLRADVPSIFLNKIPSTITFTSLALLTVSVSDPTVQSSDYRMIIGGAPLDLDVTLPEALDPSEQLEVGVQYDGPKSAVTVIPALWSPSTVVHKKKKMLIIAHYVTSQSPIKFVVKGPPRFARLASGGGRLEILGPTEVTATVPDTLHVGHQYQIQVSVEDTPYGNEVLTVTPVWEGASTALTWTPVEAMWDSTVIVRQLFITLFANEFSGAYPFRLEVKGPARFAKLAYSGKRRIESLQVIESTMLPPELMPNRQYTLGINLGVVPTEELTIRLSWDLCINIESDEVSFTISDIDARKLEKFVNLTVRLVRCAGEISFSLSGPGAKFYHDKISPRVYRTVPTSVFEVDWPATAYVGEKNSVDVFIRMTEELADEAAYVNVSVVCNGSVVYESLLHWGYGAKQEKSFALYDNEIEVVRCVFNVSAEGAVKASEGLEPRLTTFIPLINVSRDEQPSLLYPGEKNKLKITLNASGLPQRLGNDAVKSLFIYPVANTEGVVTFVPPQLRYSEDSSLEQFFYLIGTETQRNVTVKFEIKGEGKTLVDDLPEALELRVSPLLEIDFQSPPKELFIGHENRKPINVTVPEDDGVIELSLSVDGESTAFVLQPQTLRFEPNGTRVATFTVEGVYPTSRVSYVRYTLTKAPPRIMLRETDVSESMFAIPLLPITHSPPNPVFYLVEQEISVVSFNPPLTTVKCTASNPRAFTVTTGRGNVYIKAERPEVSTITCKAGNSTYDKIEPFMVSASTRQPLVFARHLTTYIGSTTRLWLRLARPPIEESISCQISQFSSDRISVFPYLLNFDARSPLAQVISVTGKSLTGAENANITLSFVGKAVKEYEVSATEIVNVSVIPKLLVTTETSIPKENGVISAYIGVRNYLRVTFFTDHPPVFGHLAIFGNVGEAPLVFCSSFPCVPIRETSPLVLSGSKCDKGTGVCSVQAFVWCPDPVSNVPLTFTVEGEGDYGGERHMWVGNVTFKVLERIEVDTSSIYKDLYIAILSVMFNPNAQDVVFRLTGKPLPGQNVDLMLEPSAGISINRTALVWAANGEGVMTEPLAQAVRVSGTRVGPNRTLSIRWRDRGALTSASNFEDALPMSIITWSVVPLIKFFVLVNGEAPDEGQEFVTYVGEMNAISIQVGVQRLPVRETEAATVSVEVGNPRVSHLSTTSVHFTAKQRENVTLSYWGKALYPDPNPDVRHTDPSNTLRFFITGPPEYQGTLTYTVNIRVLPLMTMRHSRGDKLLAVGPENALRFKVWPPVPATLTLSSFVSCGAVSFTASSELHWENTAEPKELVVTGNSKTTAPCVITTPIVGGSSRHQFMNPPFQMNVSVLSRPRVRSVGSVPELEARAVREEGLRFSLGLSGDDVWMWNASLLDFDDMLKVRAFSLTSSRSIADEPNSVAALYADQVAGKLEEPFIKAVRNNLQNQIEFQFGPHKKFYSSAREVITLSFHTSSLNTHVSFEPQGGSEFTFTIRGRKEALLGEGSNVVGSSSGVLALIGGPGASTMANKIQAIMNAFACPNIDWRDDQDNLEWFEYPIPINLGSKQELGVFAAVAVSNTLVILMCAVAMLILSYALYRWRLRGGYQDKSFAAARAMLRYPSILMLPTLLFYQGIVSASLKTTMYSSSVNLRAFSGLTFIVVGVGLMAGVGAATLTERHFIKFVFHEHDPDEKVSPVLRVMRYLFFDIGYRENIKDRYYLLRYGLIFDEFGPKATWFPLLDVVITFFLGVTEAFEPLNARQCSIKLSFTVFLFFIQFMSSVIVRPFINRFLNIVFVTAYGIQFLAMLLVAVAVYTSNPTYPGTKVAINLIVLYNVELLFLSIYMTLRTINENCNVTDLFSEGHHLRDDITVVEPDEEARKALRHQVEDAVKKQRLHRNNINNVIAKKDLLGESSCEMALLTLDKYDKFSATSSSSHNTSCASIDQCDL